jgi:hypothetical protein
MCKESLIFSNSVHLGPRTGLPDTILKGDHQRIILAKLGSNWPSSFDLQPTWPLLLKIKKRDEIKKIFISETIVSIGTNLCLNNPWIIPFQIVSGNNWPSGLRREDFFS